MYPHVIFQMEKYCTLAAAALLCLAVCVNATGANEKLVIGPAVEVYVNEAATYFTARVDRGVNIIYKRKQHKIIEWAG